MMRHTDWAVGLRILLCAGLCALLAVPAGAAPGTTDPYAGLGTWVDVWDTGVWRSPEASVARMRALGVRTLFLQTSNYSQTVDMRAPAVVGRFVEAAHANGMRIVAWYLPSFLNVARDLRRSLAAVRFRSPGGQRFDSFALDIEASVVKSVPLRNTRLATLSARLRAAVGDAYEFGAIIPSPRGMELKPKYWPGFPYASLASTFDVFVPMGYFTYRFAKPAPTATYTRANIELIRAAVGDEGVRVHVAGGLAAAASLAQVRAFVTTARENGAIGLSLYDFASTPARSWPALQS
jgi:hypothetical protein